MQPSRLLLVGALTVAASLLTLVSQVVHVAESGQPVAAGSRRPHSGGGSPVLRRQSTPAWPSRAADSIGNIAEQREAHAHGSGSSNQASGTSPVRAVGAVHRLPATGHPACLAEAFMRALALQGGGGGLGAAGQAYWASYAKPSWNCYKHGGHYAPGFDRGAGKSARFVVAHAAYYDGTFYMLGDGNSSTTTAARRTPATLRFGGYFSMVSGDWPQAVTETLELHETAAASRAAFLAALPALGGRRDGAVPRVLHAPIGYFQPPTDFLSTYHVVAETIFPTFHALLLSHAMDAAAAPGMGLTAAADRDTTDRMRRGRADVVAVTSRPVYSRYGFKPKSCREGPRCLDTVWGGMYQSLVRGIHGLGPADAQFSYLAKGGAKSTSSTPGGGKGKGKAPMAPLVYFFDRLLVGNPTHCEPLWGPDPFYAAAFGGDHGDLRGSRDRIHDLSALPASVAFRRDVFLPAYRECQQVLYAFRNFVVAEATASTGSDGGGAVRYGDADARDAVQIVFTTRKGDWARQMTNEDEIVDAIRGHLPHLASIAAGAAAKQNGDAQKREAVLYVVKFSGNLTDQIVRQLDVAKATVFIGNHGANLLNSLYLRPNSGVVTLSMRNPGFWPFAVFPSWLHWRDLVIEHTCNKRLFKGKCKWGETHNNDMYATPAQIQTLLAFLSEIVAAQVAAPKSAPA